MKLILPRGGGASRLGKRQFEGATSLKNSQNAPAVGKEPDSEDFCAILIYTLGTEREEVRAIRRRESWLFPGRQAVGKKNPAVGDCKAETRLPAILRKFSVFGRAQRLGKRIRKKGKKRAREIAP